MKRLKILVIGSGGREHTLVYRFVIEGHEVFCAPGNPGTAPIATNVAIQVIDIPGLLKFAQDNHIDLTVVGPEEPLYLGIVDIFEKHGLRIFGPRSAAAQIEKSKAFARGVMSEAMIDQPDHAVFDDYGKALEYVRARNTACFVKEDGPALGKGAHRCETIEKAQEKLHELMVQNKKRVLVEELLDGYELSAHALCHDTTSLLFPFSQDHKYSGDGDTGDMTGGMGVVVPASRSEVITTITREEIVQGILHELLAQRNPYRGLLYPGLMITKNRVKVLECNARFGDPETQTYVRHLISPGLAEMLVATIDGGLERIVPVWEPGFSVCIVMASGGYPGSYQKGFPITGIEHAEEVTGVKVFHAGTAIKGGRLVTNGGRVLGVTCCAETLDLALGRAYKAVNRIQFENKHVRYDIGAKLLGKSPGT